MEHANQLAHLYFRSEVGKAKILINIQVGHVGGHLLLGKLYPILNYQCVHVRALRTDAELGTRLSWWIA